MPVYLVLVSGEAPQRFHAKTCSPLKKSVGRLDFQRGIASINENGEWQVTTSGHQGSHVYSSFSVANCFIVLERESVVKLQRVKPSLLSYLILC